MGDNEARSDGTVISVSGQAQHVVAPDLGTVQTSISAQGPDKQAVLDQVTTAHAAALDGLRSLGGVVLTVSSTDAPLTWSTRSFSARVHYDHDYQTGQPHPAGWAAFVPVSVVLRDLSRLADLTRLLASLPDLEVSYVSWSVDPRNPAWPVVRAAAIRDAIAKARDYAAALGGQVTALLHVADAGLLGSGVDNMRALRHEGHAFAMAGSADGGDAPTLDPVPQEISAVIEARFEARVEAL
jgi:uncharacterized protein